MTAGIICRADVCQELKMDKIPTQLQLCTIIGLRRKMVRYLNDGTRFRRIDGNADDITRAFHGYLLNMLNRLLGTIDHHTFLLLLPELLPRELDRRKPKGGDRPVCNMQAVLTAFIDQVCACIVTACLTEVDQCIYTNAATSHRVSNAHRRTHDIVYQPHQ